ncbi:hypothetical protein ECO319P1_00034 [Escherichia phage ECO319P1]|nr:hypothetical protein ECO319P1_00034 [Escherichia phage ECO319P1]
MPSFGSTSGLSESSLATLREAGVIDSEGNWLTGNMPSPFGGGLVGYNTADVIPDTPPPRPARTRHDGRPLRSSSYADMFGGLRAQPVAMDEMPETSGDYYISGNVEADSEMQTIAQIVGHRATYPTLEKHPLIVGTNLAGVEIELEGITARAPRFNYWTAKGDGSLRNRGMEFVCSSPWGGRDLYNAAIEIDGWLFTAQPEDTWRCSTHVHIDVRDMTVPQLKRMILAYAVYERILFKCSGFHRYKNNFCVALGFAQELVTTLSNAWALPDNQFISRLTGNWDKYSSINMLPIQQFGSVEFRISEAKWRKGRLIRLVNRFLSLKEIAMQPFEGSESEFIQMLVNTPISKIIRKGLPKVLPDAEMDIEIGYKLAHDIISMAALRRLSIRPLVPNLSDDSRQFNVEIFEPGYEHIMTRINRSDNNVELPREAPATINFSWWYEVENLMLQMGHTYERSWFTASSNNRQIHSLFEEYCRERRAERRRQDEIVEREDDEDDTSPEFW